MEKWFGTEIVHDSPFPSQVGMIIQHYRSLAEEGFSVDEFRADCVALIDGGHAMLLLFHLGELKANLERDMGALVSEAFLIDTLTDWQVQRTREPNNAHGQRNPLLDMPIDVWVRTAWKILIEVLECVSDVSNLAASIPISAHTLLDAPPDSYSPLAKLLFPFQAHFRTPIPLVVRVFRDGHGKIEMATATKSVGALLLETIRMGLGIDDTKIIARITVHFPSAVKVSEAHAVDPWFKKKNELANLVNTTRSSARPHLDFTLMEVKMRTLLDDIKTMKSNVGDQWA